MGIETKTPVKGPKGMLRCLDALAATRSPVEKQRILEQYDSRMLRKALIYALHPRKVYGIAKIRPELTPASKLLEEPTLNDFCDLLDLLDGRRITGHDAHRMVNSYLEASCYEWQVVFQRILLKDLKCGLQLKTVNKAFKKLIPKWQVMKAHDWEDYEKKVEPPFLAELKHDGHRITCFGETGQFLTTNGLEKKGYDTVKQELCDFTEFIRTVHPQFWPVFDGELMVGIFGNRSRQEKDAGYVIFDLLWGHEIFDPDHQAGQLVRTNRLKGLYLAFCEQVYVPTRLRLSEARMINTKKELHAWYVEAIENGQEGLMVKLLKAKWKPGRSREWLKYKATYSEDLTVVGVYEGEAGTKYEGQLGGIVVRRKLKPELQKELGKKYIRVRVGGGFSDEQRKEWWTDKQGTWLVGWVAEVEFKQVTPDGSLRHPNFVRLREDK